MPTSPQSREPREPRQPQRAERKPSDWSTRPIPQPAPERRTADPDTPTLKELAERERQRTSLTQTTLAQTTPAQTTDGGRTVDGAAAPLLTPDGGRGNAATGGTGGLAALSQPPGAAAAQPAVKPPQMSDKGLAFIAKHEEFKPEEYLDAVGYRTIGYGHRIDEGEQIEQPLAEADARALMRKDLDERVYPGLDLVTVPLTQQQSDALGSFIFNVGPGSKRRGVGFAGSQLLEKLNAGEYDAVPDEMMRWNKAKGKELKGLTARRAAEVKVWSDGEY